MQFPIMLDAVQYKEKPNSAAGAIKSRLATTCAQPRELSAEMLRAFVENGGTFCPAIIRPTTNEKGTLSHNAAGFAAQQVFCVDIDNDETVTIDGKKQKRRLPDGEYIESSKALEICEACGISPFMLYHSFSSTPQLEKYRICVALPDPITDDAEREHVVSAFVSMFGRATDQSCTNADRIFFGSGAGSVFVFNPDAITQKSAFLELWQQQQQPAQMQRQSSGALEWTDQIGGGGGSAPPIDRRFDADPATLLHMINPNGLKYPEWQKITGAFINSGGDRSEWDAWCSQYAENDPRENEKVWSSSGKSGKYGKATIGTLKRAAKEAAETEYENYMNSLKEAQRAERKRARRAAVMEEFSRDSTTGHSAQTVGTELTEATATQTGGKKLPWFFYIDDHDKIRVDTAKLWQHIQRNERYFWVTNSAMEGVRRYFYNKNRHVYELMGDGNIRGLIQEYISREAPSLVKSRDVGEVYNLLTNEATDPQTGESRYKLDSYLDSTENLVNFENGFFDFYTWSMIPHQEGIISTVQLPLTFDPSRMYTLDDAPTFKHYLHDLTEGDTQKQQLLLEYMGAALSNIPGYRFKSALFLVGDPNAGKSQIILLICKLLGLNNTAKVNFAALGERFQSGTIYGKRLVHDPDMKVKQKAADTSLFKNVTGGDPIQIEFKGVNPFTTIHRGYFLFASNDFPRWSGGTDEAMYNRMFVIECRNPIPVNRRDPQLLEKMYAERKAIVSVAFQALVGAVQRGYRFTRPAALDQTLQQLRCENCPSIEFFETQCTIYEDAATNKNHRIRVKALHEAFTKWCKSAHPSSYIPSQSEFYRDIIKYKHLPDGALKRKLHGGLTFYMFTLTPDAKEELAVFDSVE